MNITSVGTATPKILWFIQHRGTVRGVSLFGRAYAGSRQRLHPDLAVLPWAPAAVCSPGCSPADTRAQLCRSLPLNSSMSTHSPRGTPTGAPGGRPAGAAVRCRHARWSGSTSSSGADGAAAGERGGRLSSITKTPVVEAYHPEHSKIMPKLVTCTTATQLLDVFDSEQRRLGGGHLFGWLTAKETIIRIAKIVCKPARGGRRQPAFDASDSRWVELLAVPKEALQQRVMHSRVRTGLNGQITDDLSAVQTALKDMKLTDTALYKALSDKLDEEKRTWAPTDRRRV